MKRSPLKALTLTGVLAALICVLTLVHVPAPAGGYVHPGDAMIMVAGYMLGAGPAAVAAALGSALADVISGYAVYAPATLIIKAVMGALAGVTLRRTKRWPARVLAMIGVEAVMVLGYGLFDWVIFGGAAALANMPFNAIQLAGGVVIGAVLLALVERIMPKSVSSV